MSTDLKDRVARVVRDEIAPALKIEGLALEVVGVADGIAQVRFGTGGTCCPGTVMMLIMGLEQELRARFPEVQHLEAVP